MMRQTSPTLPNLFSDFKKAMKPLSALLRQRISTEDDIESAERLLERLPPGKELAESVDTFRAHAQSCIKELRRATNESSGRTLKCFLELCKERGIPTREISRNSWRIGSLTLEIERDRSRVSFHYAREAVTEARFVPSEQKLLEFYEQARTKLTQFEIPEAELCEIFAEAYDLAIRIGVPRAYDSTGVPISEFHRTLRLALARRDMAKSASARLRWSDFPPWAFVYSVDRYQALQRVPGGRELSFEPGSQSTPGITVHHLKIDDQPLKVSFVRRAPGHD